MKLLRAKTKQKVTQADGGSPQGGTKEKGLNPINSACGKRAVKKQVLSRFEWVAAEAGHRDVVTKINQSQHGLRACKIVDSKCTTSREYHRKA